MANTGPTSTVKMTMVECKSPDARSLMFKVTLKMKMSFARSSSTNSRSNRFGAAMTHKAMIKIARV